MSSTREVAEEVAQQVLRDMGVEDKLEEQTRQLMRHCGSVLKEVKTEQARATEKLGEAIQECAEAQRGLREENGKLLQVVRKLVIALVTAPPPGASPGLAGPPGPVPPSMRKEALASATAQQQGVTAQRQQQPQQPQPQPQPLSSIQQFGMAHPEVMQHFCRGMVPPAPAAQSPPQQWPSGSANPAVSQQAVTPDRAAAQGSALRFSAPEFVPREMRTPSQRTEKEPGLSEDSPTKVTPPPRRALTAAFETPERTEKAEKAEIAEAVEEKEKGSKQTEGTDAAERGFEQ